MDERAGEMNRSLVQGIAADQINSPMAVAGLPVPAVIDRVVTGQ
jgi:hypothetical protein